MPGKILILGILDTRGGEVAFLRSCIEQNGFPTIVLDIGFGGEPQIQSDITREEVAESGGAKSEIVKALPRDEAHRIVIKGAINIVERLHSQQKLAGVIALGGNTTALMGSSIMRALPFGLPKFILSSAAAMSIGSKYFGTQDITMMNSVVDIVGLNSMVREVLTRAAGAICGMAEFTAEVEATPPLGKASVAITEFGLTERCATLIRQHLEQEGYDVISFHAQGAGDRAMEDLLDKGMCDAIIDLVPRRLSEQMFRGMMAAGENIFAAACRRGIPQVIAPGGLNLLSLHPQRTEFKNRKNYVLDDLRILVRLNKEEMATVGKAMAEKLNKATGPVKVLIPLRGWSVADPEGSPLYEPETDRAFVEELRNNLKPEIEVRDVEAWLEEPKFAQAVVSAFKEVMGKGPVKQS